MKSRRRVPRLSLLLLKSHLQEVPEAVERKKPKARLLMMCCFPSRWLMSRGTTSYGMTKSSLGRMGSKQK